MMKIKKLFSCLVPFITAELIQGFAYAILLFTVRLYQMVRKALLDGGNIDADILTADVSSVLGGEGQYLLSALAIVICGIIFWRWYVNEPDAASGGSPVNIFRPKSMTLLVVLAIGCQFFISGFMSLIQQYFQKLFEDYAEQLEKLDGGNIIIVIILSVFIAPFTEELIFRGMILRRARKTMPFIIANLVQALLFGIYHWNVIQGIYAAFLGFLLGIIYYKFRSILAPMLLHACINASSYLIYLIPDNRWVYLLITFAGGIATVVTLVLLKPFQVYPIRAREAIREEPS